MGMLEGLNPEKVWQYFEEISKIPHGSGNVEKISNYLVKFAEAKQLKYVQDAVKNVIIFKEASVGYEKEPALILQGHMDMVAVKTPDCEKNMKEDGLDLAVDGDYVYAKETSLGGDDGIAVAYGLAILASDDIPHPALEVVFTVDEETGMDGAAGIDCSVLKGKRLLNLDSEEEGIFLSSCAGGARADGCLQVQPEEVQGTAFELNISGLWGGHSGCDIHLERGNANMLMARLLYMLSEKCDFVIAEMEGGEADNVIPKQCRVKIVLPGKSDYEQICQTEKELQKQWAIIKEALKDKEPACALSIDRNEFAGNVVSKKDTVKLLNWLVSMPNGVCAFAKEPEGLVETSLNLGVCKLVKSVAKTDASGDMNNASEKVKCDETIRDAKNLEGSIEIHARFCVRSSVDFEKEFLLKRLQTITEAFGGTMEMSGDYPGWKYQVDSSFRQELVEIYEEMFGEKPLVQAIHAGVECGFFAGKIPGLECVSMGPNILNIHTTDEHISISSVERTWKYVLRVLSAKH